MNTIKTIILLLASCLAASANDGVYYASGNQLVPINETDVSCAKEVLTIDLNDDGFAYVENTPLPVILYQFCCLSCILPPTYR